MIIINELIEMTLSTLERLYVNDKILFNNNVNERSVVFRFGLYFNNIMSSNNKFDNLNIDCEYNRNIRGANIYKSIGIENCKRKTYPDFIIHERGTNDNNQLAIEFKKWNSNKQNGKLILGNQCINIDDIKLKYYTSKRNEYKYRLGLSIIFGRTLEDTIITIYLDGEVFNKYYYKELKQIYHEI